MTWGIFKKDEESLHVIPCDKQGFSLPPHQVDDFCQCHPEILWESDFVDNRYIMIHNEVH